MKHPRLTSALLAAAAAAGMLVVGSPAASAQIICDSGSSYRVTQHNRTFVQVDSAQLVNRTGTSATLTVQVGQQHTSTRSFSNSITASAEAGFWDFAKASASTTSELTITASKTMYASYTASANVPAHSTRTVKFGFGRYNQYIQRFHLVAQPSTNSCSVVVEQGGWVNAPFQKTFIVTT